MIETTSQNNSLESRILKKIKSGEIHMRPKAFFILKISLLVFVALLTFITSVLLWSFIIFSIKVEGHLYLLGFGSYGLHHLMLIFPWFLFFGNVVLLLFLDWLLKLFKFGYHRSLVYLFLGTLFIITILGLIVNITHFHRNFCEGGLNRWESSHSWCFKNRLQQYR